MHRLLIARELGDDGYALDDFLGERWTQLAVDEAREITVPFCDGLHFLDIDRPAGSMILCGGQDIIANRVGETTGSVGIFRCPKDREKVKKEPLIFSVDKSRGGESLVCGKWFPNDPSLFVTGSMSDGEVLVWDTENFVVAARFSLGRDSVRALDMSFAPGAKSELVAVGVLSSKDVNLLDLDSGAAIHHLQGNCNAIFDIRWSPTNPHMLASTDSSGKTCLFDVRRSGRNALLLEFDEARRMPLPDVPASALSQQPRRTNATPRRRKRQRAKASIDDNPRLLGLGCAWYSYESHSRRNGIGRRNRYTQDLVPERGVSVQVRFTPDGTRLVTADHAGWLRLWDVVTGRLISSYSDDGRLHRSEASPWLVSFLISNDGSHILTNVSGDLYTLDIEDGGLVQRGGGTFEDMESMVVHPLNEEVYSGFRNRISCWSYPHQRNL